MKVLRPVFAVVLVAASASVVDAATAAWDPNPESNIAGYKLSYGTQSGVHGTIIDVGNVTTFQFNPPAGQRYYVVVQAYTTTGELSAKSAEVVIDIALATTSVNRAPTLVQPPDQSSTLNSTVSLVLSASDPDGNILSYTSSGLPSGLSLTAATGIIAGTVSTTGAYSVTVTVSDGTLTAGRSFKWTVTDAAAAVITPTPNRAPTLLQPQDQNSKVNANVSLQLSGSDPEGTTLTFSASGLPPGLSMNAVYGLISGVPTRAGSYAVTVTASDGALSASRSFTWTVTSVEAVNRAPSLNNVPDQKDKLNANISLQLRGSDPDATPLTYSASGLPPGLSLNAASGLISGVASSLGSYQVTATASDGALSASRSFLWTVSASNGKNVVSSIAEPALSSEVTVDANSGGAEVRLHSAGRLSGVTALQDGRVLLIENDRSLNMLAAGSSVSQPILDAGDATSSLTEVAVTSGFSSTHHVFVGVMKRLDADTSEFSVVRYREVQGSLGEGAAVVGGLRYSGTSVPRFTVGDDERLYVAMPQTERSDAYSSSILRFNPDGSVPKENRVASPVVARGFGQPANLGWDGQFLMAIGADEQWSYSTAVLNPDDASSNWPQSLAPVSVGTPSPVSAAAFGVGDTEKNSGLQAFIDSSGRLFRAASDSPAGTRRFEQVTINAAVAPVAAAAGSDGRLYVIVRSDSGGSWLLELRAEQ